MSGPMLLVYPTPGDTTDEWGTVLNTLLGLVEDHDHTNGKGVQVPSAGIGIDADLPFASFAATGMKALEFTEEAAASVTSYADALFVNSSDHNLYFRNSGGVNVQLTEGNSINISLVGGIGGDYSTVNALLSYDDATKRYLLQQEGSPRPWAGLATGDLDLYQKAASIANKVTLKSPNALGASYTVTFPSALPGTQGPLFIDSSGQLSYVNTVAQILLIPGSALDLQSNARLTGAEGMKGATMSGGNAVTFPIALNSNDVINSYSVSIVKNSSNASTIHSRLYTTDASGNETAQGAGQSNNGNADGQHFLLESSLNITLTGNAYIAVWVTGGGLTDVVVNAAITYTRALA